MFLSNIENRTIWTTCIVPGCGNHSSKTNYRFFKVPNDEQKANIWLSELQIFACNLKNKINYVCELHFDDKYIGRNRLTKNAVPTLLRKDLYSNNSAQNNEIPTDNNNNLYKNWEIPALSSLLGVNTDKNPASATDFAIVEKCLVPAMVSTESQTDDMDLDTEFLKFINSNRCCACDHYEEEQSSCLKCHTNTKLYQKHKMRVLNMKKRLNSYRKQVSNLKRTCHRLRQKNKLKKKENIGDIIEQQDVNESTKNICKLLLKISYYYTDQDKTFAQCFFYKSSSAYKYLKNVWNLRLPSESSIHKWSPLKYISPGVNDVLMKQYAAKFANMTALEKLCVLCFDEIKIRKDLVMNSTTTKIEGFVDDGKERTQELADSALFFMLRGLKKKWKVPINYYLVSNLKAVQLCDLISEVIKLCTERLGVTIVLMNCDQGAINLASYKKFNITIDQPFIVINDKKIFAQHDPPHLAKSLRNALEKHNILHNEKGVASFDIIRKIYHHEKHKPVKLMPKISQQHMYPNDFQKMNVGLAKSTISYTVSCAIKTTLKTCPEIFGDDKDKSLPTADLVERFNNLNDCIDTKYFRSGSPYHQPLEVSNSVYAYLQSSFEYLEKLQIISSAQNYYKFINGYKLTIRAQLQLADYLSEFYDVTSFKTGNTDQDPLENFFSVLRGKGGFNSTPSAYEIGVHMGNIMSHQIIFQSSGSNCLPDKCDILNIDLKQFSEEYHVSLKEDIPNHNLFETADVPLIIEKDVLQSNAIMYFAGYCVFKNIKCDKCIQLLTDSEKSITHDCTFISEKNYRKQFDNFGSLKAPSDKYGEVAILITDIFDKIYKSHCQLPNIWQNLTEECILAIQSRFPTFLPIEDSECFVHLKNLLSFFILVLIRKICKWSVQNKQFERKKVKSQKSNLNQIINKAMEKRKSRTYNTKARRKLNILTK